LHPEYRGIRYCACLAVAIFYLTCCTSSSSLSTLSHSDRSNADFSVRNQVINTARKHLGDSYQFAGRGPKYFDCSGLVSYTLQNNDIDIKGSSSFMSTLGRAIDLDKARPGDLIFFKNKGQVSHVSFISKVTPKSIWVIHSTSSKGVIEEDILASSYWKTKIFKVISLSSLSKKAR